MGGPTFPGFRKTINTASCRREMERVGSTIITFLHYLLRFSFGLAQTISLAPGS